MDGAPAVAPVPGPVVVVQVSVAFVEAFHPPFPFLVLVDACVGVDVLVGVELVGIGDVLAGVVVALVIVAFVVHAFVADVAVDFVVIDFVVLASGGDK